MRAIDEHRSLHEPVFHRLVDTLTQALLDGTVTAADVRHALDLAQRLAWAQAFDALGTGCSPRPSPSPWRWPMPLMTAEQLRAHCLTRPLDPSTWQPLSQTEQARLRASFIWALAWNDWDGRPAWWWTAEHRTLLELKMACALTP